MSQENILKLTSLLIRCVEFEAVHGKSDGLTETIRELTFLLAIEKGRKYCSRMISRCKQMIAFATN